MSDKTGLPNLDPTPFDPEKHHEEWTDMLGRGYGPGSVVAVAVTAGRSASLTVGVVRRINKVNAQGVPITKNIGTWREPNNVPGATITFIPLKDSANRFSRWTDRDSTVGDEKIVALDISIADLLNSL